MRTIINSSVAAGASCVARLRMLDEKAQLVLDEGGPCVSFTNCGLPYHIGNVIEKESTLLISSERMIKAAFGIDRRINYEAIANDAKWKSVGLRDIMTGTVTSER